MTEIRAKFEKVSRAEWLRDIDEDLLDRLNIKEEDLDRIFDEIKLPRRATKGSAGYDFFIPFNIELAPGESIKIPTGVRVSIDDDYFLLIAPKSGLGAKYRFQLDNTIGIIDRDYYNSDNEGHIFIPMINDSRKHKTLNLPEGAAFAQGLFSPYGIIAGDKVSEVRHGGFGSTANES